MTAIDKRDNLLCPPASDKTNAGGSIPEKSDLSKANLDDPSLLREFIENHSDQAFAELVRRHLNLVYSRAMRIVGDQVLAEEVTQMVFLDLARKAKALSRDVMLAGWLYRSARLASLHMMRGERRRRKRELEAVNAMQVQAEGQSVWRDIASSLENRVQQLGETDQKAVRLRYFEGRSLREIGWALGLTENTAQKRIVRALEKLRLFFARRSAGPRGSLTSEGAKVMSQER